MEPDQNKNKESEMKIPVIVRPKAEKEIRSAYDWHEERRKGFSRQNLIIY